MVPKPSYLSQKSHSQCLPGRLSSEKRLEKRKLKRPAAALLKKPASKNQGNKKHEKFEDSYKLNSMDKLLLMPYKMLASCALRIKNGRQVIQVVSPQGLEESQNLAGQMKKMLESGKSLGEVRAWKEMKIAG